MMLATDFLDEQETDTPEKISAAAFLDDAVENEPAEQLSPTQQFIRDQMLSGKSMKEIQQAEGVQDPWFDLVGATSGGLGGGFGAGYRIAQKAGAGLLKSLLAGGAKGVASAIPAAAMEIPIGLTADALAGNDHENLAFLFAVGSGLASGMTIENLAERKLLDKARKSAEWAVKKFPGGKVQKIAEALGVVPGATPKQAAMDAFNRMKVEVEPTVEPTVEPVKAEAPEPVMETRPVEPEPVQKMQPSEYFQKEGDLSAQAFLDDMAQEDRIKQSVFGREGLRQQLAEQEYEAPLNRADMGVVDEGTQPPEAALAYEKTIGPTGANSIDTLKSKKKGDDSTLYLHPSTITSPLGAIGAGVDWEEYEKSGTIQIDPKRALAGLVAGAAGGMGMKFSAGKMPQWDKFAENKIIEPLKNIIGSKIVNEEWRYALGLKRGAQFADLLREHNHDIETAWNKAADIGKRIQEVAPTALEQRRLMQVIRGGVTASPKMQALASEINGMFDQLRADLKDMKLMEYSRFDKLTRRERAALRDTINHGSPEDAEKARQQLRNYYHYGSAEEYAPIYYAKHEGLTPNQRKALYDEIKTLKKQSRYNNPEGDPQLEHLIGQLEVMAGKGRKARAQLRATNKTLNQSYSHMRQEIPEEIQQLMGRIDEAPYPIAKGLGVQRTDVLKSKLFQDIANNPEWAFQAQKGQTVSMAYRKLDGDQWGALDGMHVRKDIAHELTEAMEFRNGFVRGWDTMTGWWKSGKVVWNPAAHARNLMSNTILAYLGDVHPADVATYGKAAKAVMEKETNPFFKEAYDWGLYNNTFVTAEISKLRDEIANLRDMPALKRWFQKAISLPGAAYEAQEKFFKTAVFIKARESGMSVDEAARKAEHFLFNYADIPPAVRHMKRWVSPFMTFAYKAVPLAGEMMIRKPHKMAAIMAAMYGLEQYSMSKHGISKDKAEVEREMMPKWARSKSFGVGPYNHVLMPFKDDWGNNLYLDLSYILPWGTTGEKWGQSGLPFADLLGPHPLLGTSAALWTNRDAFTGKDIYDDVTDTAGQQLSKQLEFAWRQLSPSNPLVPGSHNFDKLLTGVQNTMFGKDVKDWADRPVDLQTALLSTLLGIKMSPANEQSLKRMEVSNRKKIHQSINKKMQELKFDYRKNKITKDEYQEKARELMERKKELMMERPKP